MEKTDFMEKPIMLALSSQQYIEGLWKIGTEVSNLYAPIAIIFSSIFNALAGAILQEASFHRIFYELSSTRFTFLPPYSLGIKKAAGEEYIQGEMGRANVSFLLNAILARKMGADLSRRVAGKASEPAFLPAAEFPEGVVEKTVEEPVHVPDIVADIQSRFESKLAPSMKSMTSTLKEYSEQAFLTIPLMTMSVPRPSLVAPAKVEGVSSQVLAVPAEKEAVQAGMPKRPLVGISSETARSFAYATTLSSIVLEQKASILKTATASHSASPTSSKKEGPPVNRPEEVLTEISHAPSSPYEEAPVETKRPIVTPSARLSPEAARSFGYAAELSGIVSELGVPMPFYAETSTQAPTLTSPTSLPAGPPPSPIARTYEESETLRSAAFSLSAVQAAASTAQRIVAKNLFQSMSFEVPWTLGVQGLIPRSLSAFQPKARIEQIVVEAIKLQEPITSTVVAYCQRYADLFTEPVVLESHRPTAESALIASEERAHETKRSSGLQSAMAIAVTESSIAQRFQQGFTALISELQATQSPYGETLAELGTIGPTRAAITRGLAATPASSRSFEHYFPNAPSDIPPSAGPSLVTPTIQSTLNIAIAAEPMEEDLKDLESKISKILSEQIRRYYGSMRI